MKQQQGQEEGTQTEQYARPTYSVAGAAPLPTPYLSTLVVVPGTGGGSVAVHPTLMAAYTGPARQKSESRSVFAETSANGLLVFSMDMGTLAMEDIPVGNAVALMTIHVVPAWARDRSVHRHLSQTQAFRTMALDPMAAAGGRGAILMDLDRDSAPPPSTATLLRPSRSLWRSRWSWWRCVPLQPYSTGREIQQAPGV